MLWTIAAILLVLWLLGMVTFHALGFTFTFCSFLRSSPSSSESFRDGILFRFVVPLIGKGP
jgi:hypothetical protein